MPLQGLACHLSTWCEKKAFGNRRLLEKGIEALGKEKKVKGLSSAVGADDVFPAALWYDVCPVWISSALQWMLNISIMGDRKLITACSGGLLEFTSELSRFLNKLLPFKNFENKTNFWTRFYPP